MASEIDFQNGMRLHAARIDGLANCRSERRDAQRESATLARAGDGDSRAIHLVKSTENVKRAHRVGVSSRPSFVWADIPFLCHVERGVDIALEGPYAEIADFLRRMPDLEPAVWRTLSYFDNLVLAPWVTASTVITAGLWDEVCPPSTIFATFARLGSQDQELRPYSCLGHQITYETDAARLISIVERLQA